MAVFNSASLKLKPLPLHSVFLPASDIPSFVGKGNVDLGITGHDVILEANMQQHVQEALRLGFGKCSLQVQVPESSPYRSASDLAGKRIVTSFEVLAGKHFGTIDDEAGLTGDNRTQIEYVGGSVEAACALGLADGIGKPSTISRDDPANSKFCSQSTSSVCHLT